MQFSILHGKLLECEHAHFRSGKDNSCLEGTRVDLLKRVMDWVGENTSTQPSIFWLRGKAGCGKSTVYVFYFFIFDVMADFFWIRIASR